MSNDISKLYVRPYQLDRLKETNSCTAKNFKEDYDICYIDLDKVYHSIAHIPQRNEIIVYSTTRGVMKDGLKSIFTNKIEDWIKFCNSNKVEYWAYADDVIPFKLSN